MIISMLKLFCKIKHLASVATVMAHCKTDHLVCGTNMSETIKYKVCMSIEGVIDASEVLGAFFKV